MRINNILRSTLQNQKWKHERKRDNALTSTSMEQHNQKKNTQSPGEEHFHHAANNGEEARTTPPGTIEVAEARTTRSRKKKMN